MSKSGGERQVVRRIWPASDELEVHIDVVCTCKLKKKLCLSAGGFMNGWLVSGLFSKALRIGHNEHEGSQRTQRGEF